MPEKSDYPELVQQAGIRQMLGVSRQRVSQRVREPGFPAPAGRLATGWVWRTDEIIAWAIHKGLTVKAPPTVDGNHDGNNRGPGKGPGPDGNGHKPKGGGGIEMRGSLSLLPVGLALAKWATVTLAAN